MALKSEEEEGGETEGRKRQGSAATPYCNVGFALIEILFECIKEYTYDMFDVREYILCILYLIHCPDGSLNCFYQIRLQ